MTKLDWMQRTRSLKTTCSIAGRHPVSLVQQGEGEGCCKTVVLVLTAKNKKKCVRWSLKKYLKLSV